MLTANEVRSYFDPSDTQALALIDRIEAAKGNPDTLLACLESIVERAVAIGQDNPADAQRLADKFRIASDGIAEAFTTCDPKGLTPRATYESARAAATVSLHASRRLRQIAAEPQV